MNKRAGLLVGLLLLTATSAFAQGSLPPFKDDYFAYPGVLSSADNGDYKVIDYNEMRDINGRDSVPEKRVKDAYVSLKARAYQKDVVFQTAAGPVKAMAAGKQSGASFIVIYLHGRGGNRLQGMNDFTFGGNFNRLKNLAATNGGLYLTPDFKDFAATGEAQVAGLIEAAKATSPSAPLILACGSQGGALCWRIASNDNAGNQLSGLILLGSLWDEGFFKSPAFKKRVPVFFGHGSRDPVFAIDKQEGFYREIRKRSPGYPVQFRRFESGNHGTPIRMSDWREMLNWIFTKQ
ncbi:MULTISPECIES: alpha/beta hydrolase [Brucella]|uniref:alpha/beta hydrolase n=1 Tax=Brucella TaxID=234 RepID=UPI000DE32270|nr:MULTISPECIES: alpha/beta hydrolase [Brucella]MBK0021272.1 alpha/beta hydrolase [Ochrobactrum sp. S45]MBK0041990.1 alpha/beta hydrolase [Ochrobactrum sp. S46]UKK93224.1 alpha/beta hydrolase [Brucella pseudogrignonensis]GLU25126.1 phospholipase [Brucella sp. NBRC 12950]